MISVDEEAQHTMAADQHTISAGPADQHNVSLIFITTETEASKTATALTARSVDSGQQQGQVSKFLTVPGDGNPPPASGPPWGSICHQGGGGGGGSGGGGEGGGGGGSSTGGAPPQGGGNGKLRGNLPLEFNGDHLLMDMFINEFNLYCITNIDADQMVNLMKRAVLFLGFIKRENIKDWVKKWTNWTLTQLNNGKPTIDKYY